MDLMSSMMSRIAQLELQVQYYAKEIIEKVCFLYSAISRYSV